MKYDYLLLRPGELFLKGKNKNYFENKLISNIKKKTNLNVKKLRFRYIIDYFDDHRVLKEVFGLTSYSPVVFVEKDMEKMKKKIVEMLKGKKGKFKIETKRSDKTFPLKSPQINLELGKYVEENSSLEFSLKDFEHKVSVEINQEGVYLSLEAIKCFGGLPVGTSGNVLLYVEDRASILAGLLFMKRGCNVFPVSFDEVDISLLQRYSPVKLNLKVVEDFKEMEDYCDGKKIHVVVVRDTLNKENKGLKKLIKVVMKPLIAYDEKEVEEELKMFND